MVAPGFIDLHTHYDAQLFWEPVLSPSPLHGVTTVIGGNCGLTLAPSRPATSRGSPACWRASSRSRSRRSKPASSTAGRRIAEFLDVVEAQPLGPNIGFLVGHSAIRRAVMGEAASSHAATPEQLAAMEALLDAAIAAGGFGFSTANAATQVDGDGRPTPPNFATRDEFVGAGRGVRPPPGNRDRVHPRLVPVAGSADDDIELMADMSAAANRVLNWNKPLVNKQLPDLHRRQLAACDVAAARGGRVVPMMTPQNGLIQHDFEPGYVFRALPGWGWLFELAPADRRAALANPDHRPALEQSVAEATSGLALVVRNWSSYVVNEVHDSLQSPLIGRRIEDLAAQSGT